MIDRYKLVSRDEAIKRIHFPRSTEEMHKARQRLKFEELFYLQLRLLRTKADRHATLPGLYSRTYQAFSPNSTIKDCRSELTNAQKKW